MISAISFWVHNPTYLSNKFSGSLINLFRRTQPYLATFSNSFRCSILPLSPSLFALAVGVSGIAAACLFYWFQKRSKGGESTPDAVPSSLGDESSNLPRSPIIPPSSPPLPILPTAAPDGFLPFHGALVAVTKTRLSRAALLRLAIARRPARPLPLFRPSGLISPLKIQTAQTPTPTPEEEWVVLKVLPQEGPPNVRYENPLKILGRSARTIFANATERRPIITFQLTEAQRAFCDQHPNFFLRFSNRYAHLTTVLSRLGGNVTNSVLQDMADVFSIKVIWDHTMEYQREEWEDLPPLKTDQSLMVPVILKKNLMRGHFVDHIILLSIFPGTPGVIRYYDSQGICLNDRLRSAFIRSREHPPVWLSEVIGRLQKMYQGYQIEEQLTPMQPSYSMTCGLFVLREILCQALPPGITQRLRTLNATEQEEAIRREVYAMFLDRIILTVSLAARAVT